MKEKIRNWKLWFEQLPYNLKPNNDKAEELEKLRSHAILGIFPFPNDMFVMIILSSAWATRRMQENVYAMVKEKMPNTPEKEILKVVFRSRVFSENPVGLKMNEEEINKEMKNINSLDNLIEYFLQKEKGEREEFRFTRDIFGIGKNIANKVDKILEQ